MQPKGIANAIPLGWFVLQPFGLQNQEGVMSEEQRVKSGSAQATVLLFYKTSNSFLEKSR